MQYAINAETPRKISALFPWKNIETKSTSKPLHWKILHNSSNMLLFSTSDRVQLSPY